MNIKHAVVATLAALTVGHATAGLAANPPSYGRSAAPAPLEGTWVVTIKPYLAGCARSSGARLF